MSKNTQVAEVEQVAVGELLLHPQNPRVGNVEEISKSILANGWWGTLVAQRSTNMVLAGNHRLLAAQQLELDTVPVYWLDCDDEQALKILLADNRTSDISEYDEVMLGELLTSLTLNEQGLLGTGFGIESYDDLMRSVEGQTMDITDHEAEWTHMPEFNQEDKMAAFRAVVHFASEKNADDFFKMLGVHKQKILWWPEHDGLVQSDIGKSWEHEEEE